MPINHILSNRNIFVATIFNNTCYTEFGTNTINEIPLNNYSFIHTPARVYSIFSINGSCVHKFYQYLLESSLLNRVFKLRHACHDSLKHKTRYITREQTMELKIQLNVRYAPAFLAAVFSPYTLFARDIVKALFSKYSRSNDSLKYFHDIIAMIMSRG